MVSTYKEECVKHKNEKQQLAADVPMPHIKKKVKKNKKANHKHEYIPGIYISCYTDYTGTVKDTYNYGFHCEHCGRIQNLYFMWGSDKVTKFKEEHPDCVQIKMPDNWDYWKNMYVPLDRL